MALKVTAVVSGTRWYVDDDRPTRAGYHRWWIVLLPPEPFSEYEIWSGGYGREVYPGSQLGKRIIGAIKRTQQEYNT